MFYVYEHLRPDTNTVFYVGKGSGWRSGTTQHRNTYWKNVVAKAGKFSVRKIVQNVDEELAFLAECERIDQLKRLGIKLTNLTDGGEGSSNPSEETRRKMSECRKGEKNPRFNLDSRRQRYARKEFVPKEVMSANMKASHWSKTGVYSPPKGIRRNEADILKMKEAQKNIPLKECLHCGYKARPLNIRRWHNENCKLKGKKMSENTKKTQSIFIDNVEHDLDAMNDEQKTLVQHCLDLDRKLASIQFQAQQLEVGKAAFLKMLKDSLEKPKE
jgi:Zn ribbon nucleic-acid-binding protein